MIRVREVAKKKASGAGPKKVNIRVRPQLAEDVSWVVKALGTSSAKLMERILRPQIDTLYAENKSLIEKLKQNAAKSADAQS